MSINIKPAGIRWVDFIAALLPPLAAFWLLALLGSLVPIFAGYYRVMFGGKALPYLTEYLLEAIKHSPVPFHWLGLAIMLALFAVVYLIVRSAPSPEVSVRRLFLLASAEWCCIWFATFVSLLALTLPFLPAGSIWEYNDFSEMPQIVKSFAESRSVSVYEGLPSQYSERSLFQQQLKANPTLKIGNYDFYQSPLELAAWQKSWLKDMMTTERPFVRLTHKNSYVYFHPDFALEWQDVSGKKYDALICLDCSEVIFIGPPGGLHCDIAIPVFQDIRDILIEYHKNLPDAARQ